MDINKIKELAEGYLQEQVDLLMRFTSVAIGRSLIWPGLSLKPSPV